MAKKRIRKGVLKVRHDIFCKSHAFQARKKALPKFDKAWIFSNPIEHFSSGFRSSLFSRQKRHLVRFGDAHGTVLDFDCNRCAHKQLQSLVKKKVQSSDKGCTFLSNLHLRPGTFSLA
jgi:hypothetical protein